MDDPALYVLKLTGKRRVRAILAMDGAKALLRSITPFAMHNLMAEGRTGVISVLRAEFTGHGFTADDYDLIYALLEAGYARLQAYEKYALERATRGHA